MVLITLMIQSIMMITLLLLLLIIIIIIVNIHIVTVYQLLHIINLACDKMRMLSLPLTSALTLSPNMILIPILILAFTLTHNLTPTYYY